MQRAVSERQQIWGTASLKRRQVFTLLRKKQCTSRHLRSWDKLSLRRYFRLCATPRKSPPPTARVLYSSFFAGQVAKVFSQRFGIRFVAGLRSFQAVPRHRIQAVLSSYQKPATPIRQDNFAQGSSRNRGRQGPKQVTRAIGTKPGGLLPPSTSRSVGASQLPVIGCRQANPGGLEMVSLRRMHV